MSKTNFLKKHKWIDAHKNKISEKEKAWRKYFSVKNNVSFNKL